MHIRSRLHFGLVSLFSILAFSSTQHAQGESFSGSHASSIHNMMVTKDIAGLSFDPADFHAHSGPQKQWAIDLIDRISFDKNDNVLDIGCADGKISAFIASKVPQGNVVGVDISQYMVEFATQVYGSQHNNLIFQQGDMRNLELNQQFDKVISTSTLHWFSDQPAAVRSLAQVLKPNGTLYIKSYDKKHKSLLDLVIDKVASRLKWRLVFNTPSNTFSTIKKSALKQCLKESGFAIQKAKTVKCRYAFKDKNEFLDWMLVWKKVFQKAPSVTTLPDAVYRGFAEEILDLYLQKQPADENGHIHYTEYMVEIEAKKNNG